MGSFTGKTVYITGGSSGIGLALGQRLAALGADILILARSEPGLARAQQEIQSKRRSDHQKIDFMSLDVGDQDQVYEKMEKAAKRYGVPDIFILSAGINTAADHFHNISHDMFSQVMNVNVNGVRNPIHALIGPIKQKKTHLVILSSAAALFGMFGYTAYATSKAALMGFAESLRYELKPHGIPVTIVFPPDVDTPMNEGEALTLPAQGKAVKKLAGLLTPEFTAKEIVKAIKRKTYFCIPGRQTKFLYLLHRISNGFLSRVISDLVIGMAGKKRSS